ncbi:MAG: tetratricopeptide repeat protein [Planctomycetota bacterium JB042]
MNDEKIATWRARVEAAPDDELARFTLGRACFEAGRLDDAASAFEEAVRMKADWMMAWVYLGRARLERDDAEGAREALTRARALAVDQGHDDPIVEIDELLEEADA